MNVSGSVKKVNAFSIADFLLDAACFESRVIDETIAVFGDSTVSEYLDSAVHVADHPFQCRDDLLDAVYEYVAPLLGGVTARRVRGELDACPVALTTNHHGVDFFAQSVQGSVIFSLRAVNGRRARTVPVFACGGIPLDNLTYPQGLLLYHVDGGQLGSMPRKLPIFSNRLRRQTASVAGPIGEEMIQRARRRASRMADDREISAALLDTVQRVLDEDYACSAVTRLPAYSDQAVVLNQRIWKRLFTDQTRTSDLVYLELEKITATLLERDLFDPHSLVSCTILDSLCRAEIVEALNGVGGCWEKSKLMDRIGACHEADRGLLAKRCGTMFFWGINDQHRKVPLCLVTDGAHVSLRGIDDGARQFEHAFDPKSLVDGLREKRLLPSLFTCFLTLSLARGVTCLGGYYQAEYLPRIQRGLAAALRGCGGYTDAAKRVEKVHTKGYLGGMQAVSLLLEDGLMSPAGPAEISASGGLSAGDLEQIRSCTIADAHIASLFETIPDLGLGHIGPVNWKSELALDCAKRLSGRVVCKSLSAPGKARSGDGPLYTSWGREVGLSV